MEINKLHYSFMDTSELRKSKTRQSLVKSRLIDRFNFWGKIRYRWWQVFGRSLPFSVTLRSGEKIRLRPESTDWSVANEVFDREVYRLPVELAEIPIRRIVDIGGNVGFTTLYWMRRLPNARVLAFEPHPENVEAFREHIRRNLVSNRVELLPVAAGVRAANVTLWDGGSGSSLVLARRGHQGRSFEVPLVDYFSSVGAEPIDLLKIDIEGAEYDLLDDPRFFVVKPRIIAMEWHAIPSRPDAGIWCLTQLRGQGYVAWQTEESHDKGIGMIWAMLP